MKPNILLIVTDQEYAHPQLPEGYRLPHHERLQARGVTFDNFQATTTLCTPSRACLYTGQHTPRNGMYENDNFAFVGAMSTDIPTMGTLLREQGYDTAYKGKWHLGQLSFEQTTADTLEPYGFGDFQTNGDTHGRQQEGATRDAKFADEAIAWLENRTEADTPFLLAVNFINPHDVMFFRSGPQHSKSMMALADAPEIPQYQQQWDVPFPVSFNEQAETQPPFVAAYKAATSQVYGLIPDDDIAHWQRHLNYYYNCLQDVDAQLGRLLDCLETTALLDNTIVVYLSDHGDMAGAHGLTQKGNVLYRELVNVPLIVAHPNGAQGQRTQAAGSMVDILPTMLAWVGAEVDLPELIGSSLADVVQNPDTVGPRGSIDARGTGALFTYDNLHTYDPDWMRANGRHVVEIGPDGIRVGPAERYERDIDKVFAKHGLPDTTRRNMARGVFDGRYKLVRHFAIDNYNLPHTLAELYADNDVALFDLLEDPHEMVNLANTAHPDYDEALVAEMNAKLNALIAAEIGVDESPYGLKRID